MKEVLTKRRGVISGASIQGRYLARATPVGNLKIIAPDPSVQRYASEELHFRRLDPKAFSVKNGQRYLHKYPEGRHVVQVRSWIDDVAFGTAKKSLQIDNDPEPLRAYMDEHINHYLKAQTLLHDAGALTP